MNNIFVTRGMYADNLHQIVQLHPACFYTRCLQSLPHVQPTPEELAEAARIEADYAAMEAEMGSFYPDWYGIDCYTTEEAAIRAATLHAALSNLDDDMRVFHAPSECYASAGDSKWRELDELEQRFGTRHPDAPKPNPYSERGVEDRTLSASGEQRAYRMPLPESVHECEFGDEEYQWHLKQAGL
jgi:hypothetical protein